MNDDVNAISRLPAMEGNAMRRAINRAVYSILTSNPNLSDGIALFHATSHGDTIDLTFLQGEEAPVLERMQGFEVDSVKYKVRQSFAAAPIDFRGLYQGNS